MAVGWESQVSVKRVLYWLAMALLAGAGPLTWMSSEYCHVDHAELVYHARELTAGRIPYRDIVTHHFLGYVLPFWLLSWFLPADGLTLKVAAWLLKLLTAVTLFFAARRICGPRAGYLAGFLAVTVGYFFPWQGSLLNVQGNIEPLLALLLLLCIAAPSEASRNQDARYAFIGAVLGVLVVFDQRCMVFGPLVLVAVFASHAKNRARAIGAAALGGTIPITLALSYLFYHGALDEFYRHTIRFPLFFRNAHLQFEGQPPALRLFFFSFQSEPVASTCAWFAVMLALATSRFRWVGGFLALGLVSAWTYASLGGRYFTNYLLPLSPFIVSGMALLPSLLWERKSDFAARIAERAMAGYGLFYVVMPFLFLHQGRELYAGCDESVVKQVETYVEQLGTRGRPLFVWGYKPQVYLRTNSLSDFGDVTLLSVIGGNPHSTDSTLQGYDPSAVESLQSYLHMSMPAVIVDIQPREVECEAVFCFGRGEIQRNMNFREVPHLAFLDELLRSKYRITQRIEGRGERANVYLRND